MAESTDATESRTAEKKRRRIAGIPCLQNEQAGMTEHHTTYSISVATINQLDVIFQNSEVIILRNVLKTKETFTYISWTYRDLTNSSDKCPRTILKELGSSQSPQYTCLKSPCA